MYEPNQQTCTFHVFHSDSTHGFSVQKVEFEDEGAPSDPLKASVPSTPISPTSRSTRLSRYLDDLNLRTNESPIDFSEQNIRENGTPLLQSTPSIPFGLSSAPSRSSLSGVSLGMSYSQNPAQSNRNPEADSFAYMETLLEALAVLGKLGLALDIVAQKLPQEVYSLVDATIDEVAERAEYGRRTSMLGPAANTGVGRPSDVYFQSGSGVSVSSTYLGMRSGTHGHLLPASSLRLAVLEMSTKRGDQEIMKDLFWTLYSKLDAVAQGLRVIYEVSNRIGSVGLIALNQGDYADITSREETSKTRRGQNRGRYSLWLKFGLLSKLKCEPCLTITSPMKSKESRPAVTQCPLSMKFLGKGKHIVTNQK